MLKKSFYQSIVESDENLLEISNILKKMTSFWWIRHAPVIGNNQRCYGNNEVECDLSDINSFKVV